MIIDVQQLTGLERRYRATLINSLAGVRPAILVGTADASGVTNLAVFNSVIHIGADPAYVGLLFRPSTVERHTLENLEATGWYSINYMPSTEYVRVHQCSAKYPAGTSEFTATGLTPIYDDMAPAPMVGEAVIRILLKLEYQTVLPMNGTILVVGSIVKIFIPDGLVSDDGYVSHEKGDTLACAGLDAYFQAKEIGRLPYARPTT